MKCGLYVMYQAVSVFPDLLARKMKRTDLVKLMAVYPVHIINQATRALSNISNNASYEETRSECERRFEESGRAGVPFAEQIGLRVGIRASSHLPGDDGAKSGSGIEAAEVEAYPMTPGNSRKRGMSNLWQRLEEMDYALVAGNTKEEPIPCRVLREWVFYVQTGKTPIPVPKGTEKKR